jgi:hypothetical protein
VPDEESENRETEELDTDAAAGEENEETVIEPEEQNIVIEPSLPASEIINEDIDTGSLADEDFFSLFSAEIKKVEESDADLKKEADEMNSAPAKSEEVDSFLDFEEETENLLRAFKETEDELNSKNTELFQDSGSITEKAAMDLIKDFHDENDKRDTPAPSAKEDEKSRPVKKTGRYKEKKIRNILDSISNNDVEKIISNVFNDDKEDFTTTMEKLNECANYDQATEILKGVFLTYRVNPYTKDALTLTNTVANYFTRE